MPALAAAIRTLLEDPYDQILARSLLGTVDADAIAARVEAHVRAELGREIVDCLLVSQSVGAVFALELAGGARVVLKAHALSGTRTGGLGSLAEVEAVYAAQAELHAAGFPCAPIVRPPRPFGDGAAVLMGYLPAPPVADAHAPAVRHALVRAFARVVELGPALASRERLPRRTLPASLFHEPHNALFDFTAPGGEWIDARARAARAVLDAHGAPPVVMHTDFSCTNAIVEGDRVVAVYDLDSVAWMDELHGLAQLAVHYTYTGGPASTLPSRDEARAFVADYLAVRGRTLAPEERAVLDAAAIYALAYTARCAHQPGRTTEPGARLAAAPDAYF